MSKSIVEQHQEWCIHYKRLPGSPKREACEVGVIYDDLVNVKELGTLGCYLRLPCLKRNHMESERKGQPLFECPHMRFPTIEESKSHEKEVNAHLEKFTASLPLISKVKKEHKGKDWNGVEVCPICKGKLHMTHSSCNGHVWGHCETKDCLSWME